MGPLHAAAVLCPKPLRDELTEQHWSSGHTRYGDFSNAAS